MPLPIETLAEWLFGSAARSRVIEKLFEDPRRAWTKSDLARAVSLQRASVADPLAGLVAIGAVIRDGRRFRADVESEIGQAFVALLEALSPVAQQAPP